MIPASNEYIQALKSPIKTAYIKLEFYNSRMDFINEFTKKVNKGDLGGISVNFDRPTRREFSFTLENTDNQFNWGETNLVWIDKRIKLYTGLKLLNGNIEYVPQGVFILTEPIDRHNTDGKKVTINAIDKSFLLTDKRGKFINETKIETGAKITDAIKLIAKGIGETLFNFDIIDATVPYELTYQPDDNRWQAIKELSDLARCDVYYDVNGYLRLRKIEIDDFDKEPSVWRYEYGSVQEKFYAGNTRKFEETNLANHIRVLGGSGQTATVIYDLTVDEAATHIYAQSLITKEIFQQSTISNLIRNNEGYITLPKYGVDYAKTEDSKADFETGTLTDLIVTDGGSLQLSEGKTTGNRVSPVFDISSVNIVNEAKISWTSDSPINTEVKIETRFSTDGGSTWSVWATATNLNTISGLTKGLDVSNGRLQVRQTLITKDASINLELIEVKVNISSAYKKTTGTIDSIVTGFDANTDKATKVYINYFKETPVNTSISVQLSMSKDNGVTWDAWRDVKNGDTLISLDQMVELQKIKIKYKATMSTSDYNVTPVLKSISLNADIPDYWKGNPYSIQKIGKATYFHNSGNPDPLITNIDDAKWRAKWELIKRLGYSEVLNLESAPVYILEAGDIIEIEDSNNNVTGKYRIKSINIPLIPDKMTCECVKFRNYLSKWKLL